ncbi:MAG: hypothetical protein HS115_11820 [Spirochaetales bacterium]|nr:hypothetical protein [Spirochaetales bacterium]
MASAVIIAMWLLSGWLIYNFIDAEQRGTFGDMFGAINALFSGLAFAVLIFTVSLQRRELELQRYELESTRKELSRSAKAAEIDLRLTALSSQISAYSVILNPSSGMKNRTIASILLNEDDVKVKLVKALTEIEAIQEEGKRG